jgi:hypothetical protein
MTVRRRAQPRGSLDGGGWEPGPAVTTHLPYGPGQLPTLAGGAYFPRHRRRSMVERRHEHEPRQSSLHPIIGLASFLRNDQLASRPINLG